MCVCVCVVKGYRTDATYRFTWRHRGLQEHANDVMFAYKSPQPHARTLVSALHKRKLLPYILSYVSALRTATFPVVLGFFQSFPELLATQKCCRKELEFCLLVLHLTENIYCNIFRHDICDTRLDFGICCTRFCKWKSSKSHFFTVIKYKFKLDRVPSCCPSHSPSLLPSLMI